MDKDTNMDYTMKNQVIFNSPRSHCEELNDEAIQKSRDCFANARNDNTGVSLRGSETTEAIQYNMSFRAEREILTLNEVKNLRSLTRVRDDKWFTSYCLFSRFAPSG